MLYLLCLIHPSSYSVRTSHHSSGTKIQGNRAAVSGRHHQHANRPALRWGHTSVPCYPSHQHSHSAELDQADAHEESTPAYPQVRPTHNDTHAAAALIVINIKHCVLCLCLCRFTVDAEVDLKAPLSALGLTDMFSQDKADFRHLCKWSTSPEKNLQQFSGCVQSLNIWKDCWLFTAESLKEYESCLDVQCENWITAVLLAIHIHPKWREQVVNEEL